MSETNHPLHIVSDNKTLHHQQGLDIPKLEEKNLNETVNYIKSKLPAGWNIDLAIICGSGLSCLGESVQAVGETPLVIKYEDIPNFPVSTVQGHQGKLVFGLLRGKRVVCMMGRFHFYEGYPLKLTAYPVRVFSLLGCHSVIVTNASGSLSANFKNGDIMLIKDHINMPGMAGNNPLIGPNLSSFGPRFPATSDAYDFHLRKHAIECYRGLGYDMNDIHEGVYVFVSGPSYETPAEARMLSMIGADAVGMSTVPEVIVARHCGMRVLGISLITNTVLQPEHIQKKEMGEMVICATHDEVLEMSQKRARCIQSLVESIIERFPTVS